MEKEYNGSEADSSPTFRKGSSRLKDNINDEEKERKIISYPEIGYIRDLYPNPEMLLGKKIIWEEKRDGSNCGAYLDKDDQIRFRSRHMEIAEQSIIDAIYRTRHIENLKDCLMDSKHQWHSDNTVFFELLMEGKSPTRTELHEEDDLTVFDIYSFKSGWLNYNGIYQMCYHFKLPVVRVFGISQHVTIESLLSYRDKMLEKCLKEGREGIVGKVWKREQNGRFIMFKEKLDMPDLDKIDTHIETGKPILPMLPESEIMGAIEKVLIDIGMDQFKDVSKAMPLVARYVNEESKKHNCQNVKKPFDYYQRRLGDLKE